MSHPALPSQHAAKPVLRANVLGKAGSRFYHPELDALRFFACFLVFNRHLLPVIARGSRFAQAAKALNRMGVYGVCLFFVLSAYLISELLLREKETTGAIHLKGFYMRRILRIWPLYFLVLFLVVIIPASTPHTSFEWKRILAFIALSGNWFIAFNGWPSIIYLSPLWTISLEEQFYLLWPTVVKKWGSSGMLTISVGSILLSYLVIAVLSLRHVSGSPGIWCNSFVQFQFFGIGAMLALALHNREYASNGGGRRLLCGLAGVSILYLVELWLHLSVDDVPGNLAAQVGGFLGLDLGSILIFLAVFNMHMPPWTKALSYLGKISFGLYVFHLFATFFIDTVVLPGLGVRRGPLFYSARYVLAALFTLVIASMSYRYFETPFLRLKERFTFVRSRPA